MRLVLVRSSLLPGKLPGWCPGHGLCGSGTGRDESVTDRLGALELSKRAAALGHGPSGAYPAVRDGTDDE
jgi:hypothetical protein